MPGSLRRLSWRFVCLSCVLWLVATRSAYAQAPDPDPNLWLEQVDSPRAMQWVHEENAKTRAVLEKDPHYAGFYRDALRIAEAKDRIPMPQLLHGQVFNFWRDAEHVRGIWRRTSLADYRSAAPHWTSVLDLDALAKQEHANWVWEGVNCAQPDESRCLISLSDGGEDAVTVREFDLTTQRFAAHGFVLPRGKQDVSWLDDQTLLVAREWVAGELTASGYPFVVKKLARGQALSEATEVFRGKKEDVSVAPLVLRDGDNHQIALIRQGVSFFESVTYLITDQGIKQLPLPLKSDIKGLVGNQLVLSLDENWDLGTHQFALGDVVSLRAPELLAAPDAPKPQLLYSPGPRASFGEAAVTRSALLLTTLDEVKGRAFVYAPQADGSWSKTQLDLPDEASVDLIDSDLHSGVAFLTVSSFLLPTSLWQIDSGLALAQRIKTLPARFDAAHDSVEQFEATSSDGTKVPYFVVHPSAMKLDGTHPTILNAYGGFQVSMTPTYSGVRGKLWLEHGGVFVLANIRGGGEFGPAWHEAGLKTHRQRIFDDFAAVGEDLIERKITSPEHLGIMGGSNGGLLMGVEFIQHPALWHAVDIQVPLLDMLRYEQIAAGASWVGEYGSVSHADERAFLASISPYANLKAGVAYPEPLVWTTTKDDRVGPQHARKFAARLSALGLPYFFYEVVEGGHGSGANLKESAETNALEYTYFARQLGAP